MFSAKSRTTLVAVLASLSFGGASVLPAVSQAKPKGQTSAVTCPDEGFSGGPGQPGEIAYNKYVIVNDAGQFVGVEDEMICGADGKWHKVANIAPKSPSTGTAIPVGTTVKAAL
jgi:hypothetical protein